jgi:hypothetical protein
MPRRLEDIKDYKQGIPDDWMTLIFQWAKKQCSDFPAAKNWDVLNLEWSRNEQW